MSFIVSGPRRVYVLMLFCQRLRNPCAGCPRALSRAARTIGADPPDGAVPPCADPCHLVLTIRLHRILWRRLVGLSLLVLDAQP